MVAPFLAGNDANLLAFPVRRDEPRLPPLVIRGVDDMEDVAVGEAEALAGQTAVPRPVIVKQSSAKTRNTHISCTSRRAFHKNQRSI